MDLTAPRFTNPDAAREHLEALRWPEGPFCPHCGSVDATRLKAGKARPGTVQCNDCRQQFTVTVGTVFESSKVPLHKWLLVNHLMCASKKGISAHQVHRMIGVTYKTAWFMCHRLREAMRSNDPGTFGDGGGIVEVDETFIGRDRSVEKKTGGFQHKMKVLALVDRATGGSRAMVVDRLTAADVAPHVNFNLAREAQLVTDKPHLHPDREGVRLAPHRPAQGE